MFRRRWMKKWLMLVCEHYRDRREADRCVEAKIDTLLVKVEHLLQKGIAIVTELENLQAAVGRVTTEVGEAATELRRLAQLIIDSRTDPAAIQAAADAINAQADALDAAVAENPEEVPPAP